MSKEIKFIYDYSGLMGEWNWKKNNQLDIEPGKLSYCSSQKVCWICKDGHEWEAVINSRNKGIGCPICYNEKRSKYRKTKLS